ncbi:MULTISPECIES: PhzF family phenazine biosynthesis protein [unclassified Devosia]|uniref:PhzF family phenazine biosynthesis protein n=1 Tax=unclassified Devosia TaxID=196773 RepID=UPI00145D4E1F|nr:PhzF family phenazine biosynthesis protein [Devosia sp. MC521]MBJ6986561.1 PhzF family phenazine biosynthesis protein [Devosia sp. MC521]QMW61606.1 PhzF family phenazine biosynthesis protein [Devosia sp. MC521]
MKRDYLLLDVFTRSPLRGNPLAVLTDATGLLDDEMQAIAKEFNLSETVFFLKPVSERNAASIRIFTPTQELPFAGHPTVGAAVVLGLNGRGGVVRIEEQIGLVSALVEKIDHRTGSARFTLPKFPEFVGDLRDTLTIAQALGLEPEDIGCEFYKPAGYSAGNPFHLIPVRSTEVLKRIEPNALIWEKAFPFARNSAYIFTLTPNEPGVDIAARMFNARLEDPGTGSAAAALIGMLATQLGDNEHADYGLRQGHEMGRPCRMTIHIKKEAGALTHAAIGGDAVIIASGTLEL